MEIPMPSLEQVSWLTVARLGETLSISCLSSQASGGDRLLSGRSGRARKSKSTAVGLQSLSCTLMESFCIEVLCWVCKAVLSCDCFGFAPAQVKQFRSRKFSIALELYKAVPSVHLS